MANKSCKVVAIEHLTLDGVFQAPARPDEDTRDGFKHGGWSTAADNPKTQEVIGRYMEGGWSLLVGRTTYEDLYEGWSVRQPNSPMTQALTSVEKFVTCRDVHYNLPWSHSTLLAGEANQTVSKLKIEHGKTLIIFGSSGLVRSLMEQDLVDEFVLLIHPLVLGEGRRFFEKKPPLAHFTLREVVSTDTGLVMVSYRRK